MTDSVCTAILDATRTVPVIQINGAIVRSIRSLVTIVIVDVVVGAVAECAADMVANAVRGDVESSPDAHE